MSAMANDYSTGLELILNSCENALQIVVTNNEKPLCFEEWHTAGKATEILAPALEQICAALGIELVQFRRVGCFAGPGSFTGIRLVLTTAAAIRRIGQAKLASLDYMQALATSAVKRRGWLYPGKVFVVTHARRNLIHFQEFISFGPDIPAQPVTEVELLAPEKARQRMTGQRALACGSGLASHADIFLPQSGNGQQSAAEVIYLPELVNPDLGALCLLARHGDYFPNDVEPKYVRGCDAMEHLVEQEGPDSPRLKQLTETLNRAPESQV